VACAREALPKVRPEGWVLLDNSDRTEYSAVFERYARYPVEVFDGLVPYTPALAQAAAWRIAPMPGQTTRDGRRDSSAGPSGAEARHSSRSG